VRRDRQAGPANRRHGGRGVLYGTGDACEGRRRVRGEAQAAVQRAL